VAKKISTIMPKTLFGIHDLFLSLCHRRIIKAEKIKTVYTDQTHGCTAAKSKGIVAIIK
jgi:hypothetical protein